MKTSLHIAAWRRDLARVRELLTNGADPDALDDKSRLPLHRIFEDSGGTAGGPRDLLGSMLARLTTDLDRADHWDFTPLVQAISYRCFHTARALVGRGCSLNRTSHGRTPLLAASALTDGHEFVKLLLRAGANIHCVNEIGNSPLHLAQDKRSLWLLLQAGANFDQANHNGLTALGLARQEKRKDKVLLLREAGAKQHYFEGKKAPEETEYERFMRRLQGKM